MYVRCRSQSKRSRTAPSSCDGVQRAFLVNSQLQQTKVHSQRWSKPRPRNLHSKLHLRWRTRSGESRYEVIRRHQREAQTLALCGDRYKMVLLIRPPLFCICNCRWQCIGHANEEISTILAAGGKPPSVQIDLSSFLAI